MVECKRHRDIIAELPRPNSAAVDVMVTHASEKFYNARAIDKQAGWGSKLGGPRRGLNKPSLQGSERMCQIMMHSSVPFAVEACTYIGKEAAQLLNQPEGIVE